MKFYSSIRLEIRRGTTIKENNDEKIVGNRTKINIVKNKVAPPFMKSEFNIIFGLGIDKLGEMLELGVKHEIIELKGSWYNYGDLKLGQGTNNAKKTLLEKENRELLIKIYKSVRKAVFENYDNEFKYSVLELPSDVYDVSSVDKKNEGKIEKKEESNSAEKPESKAASEKNPKKNIKIKKSVA